MATTKKAASDKKATSKAKTKTTSKAKAKKTTKANGKNVKVEEPQQLKLLRNDKYLAEYAAAIEGRHQHALDKINELTNNGATKLSDFASGYLYFGLHQNEEGEWILREWAPNATAIYVIGDFNKWQEKSKYAMKRLKNSDNWEIKLPQNALKHGDQIGRASCRERV